MKAKIWIPANPIGLPSTANAAFIAAWIEEFRQAMLDIGLVQTGDTGQFNLGTFTFAHTTANMTGSHAEFTYLMFAFDDDLQGGAPIYIRLGFRQGCGFNGVMHGRAPFISVQVGTGTNGAGTLTGATTTSVVTFMATGSTTPDLTASVSANGNQSFACYNPERGFLGVVYCPGVRFSTSFNHRYALACFFIERVPDEFGSPTPNGFSLWANPTSYAGTSSAGDNQSYPNITTALSQTVMASTGFVSGARSHHTPYNDASSILTADGDIYLSHAYHITPHPVRSVGLAAIASGHNISHGTQLEFTPYGTEPSNFVVMGWTPAFRLCAATTNANPVFLFE